MDFELVKQIWLALMTGAGFLAYQMPRVYRSMWIYVGATMPLAALSLTVWSIYNTLVGKSLPDTSLYVLVFGTTAWLMFLDFLARHIQADRDNANKTDPKDH